jgi:predicted RecA/RadA family phage recombinase
MKNYVQKGENITLPAPYDVASGAGALIGSIFGVASATVTSGQDCSFVRIGVFTLPKPGSQAWEVGVKLYWDNTAKNVTTTSTSNTPIGAAAAVVGSGAGETSGKVLITGQIS